VLITLRVRHFSEDLVKQTTTEGATGEEETGNRSCRSSEVTGVAEWRNAILLVLFLRGEQAAGGIQVMAPGE
jgi:hypothetical protein